MKRTELPWQIYAKHHAAEVANHFAAIESIEKPLGFEVRAKRGETAVDTDVCQLQSSGAQRWVRRRHGNRHLAFG
jgi:hypothetical protein